MNTFARAFLIGWIIFSQSSVGVAWALLSYVAGDRAQGYLLGNVMSGTEIKYVLEIEDPTHFPDASLQVQVETALKVWLLPFQRLGWPRPSVTRVDARTTDINLLVQLVGGKPTQTADMNVFVSGRHPRPYSKITIRTNYLVSSERNEKRSFRLKNFDGFLNPGVPLADQLFQLSTTGHQDVFSFSERHRRDWRRIWNSTYPTLMHELGHVFGLADTGPDQLDIQSLPEDRSRRQPDSIMQSSNHFSPQRDDLEGITAVVKKHLRLRTFSHFNRNASRGPASPGASSGPAAGEEICP